MLAMALIVLRGLPGSGKSTWAAHYVACHPDVTIAARATIAEALAAQRSEQGPPDDDLIVAIEHRIVREALAGGRTVIVDDVNLHPHAMSTWMRLGDEYGTELIIKSFTDVPVEECIRRDAERERPVGEDVIRHLFERYIERRIFPISTSA